MSEQQEPIGKQPGASVALGFTPPLPCTTQDCPNVATVATAHYDWVENGWMMFPLCISCTRGLLRNYEGEAST